MRDLSCDVAVIGAGTAGLAAERRAREAGARTLLIDEAFAGTTCATVGCMPSKLLIAAADAAWAIPHAACFGIRASADVDGRAVLQRVREERDRFAGGVKRGIESIPQDVRLRGRARFTGTTTLRLEDGRAITARAVVIATGATPSLPEDFAHIRDLVLTNETIFEMEDLPRSLAVIGAGPLGLELGQALARLGARVEIFDRGTQIGGLKDAAVAATLRRLLERDMPLHLGVEPETGRGSGGAELTWDGNRRDFERVLLATGRPPDLSRLELGATELGLDDHGVPRFDRRTMQCGDLPVFIAGDANSDRPLLHEASHEGSIAGRNAAAYPDVAPAERHVALAITFTRPENAVVGEVPDPEDADYVTADASFDDQGRARVEARLGGLCRLHARRGDGRLTGASLCAPDAAHLAHLFAWAIEAKLSVGKILGLPVYHPMFEEGLKPALRALCDEAGQDPDPSRRHDAPCA